MKKLLVLISIMAFLFAGCDMFDATETKTPPSVPGVVKRIQSTDTCPDNSICFETDTGVLVLSTSTVSATGTEYVVWAIPDSNGDIVAMSTVECSVITDGSQVCQIHYWVMSDTAGTLTEEFTIDIASD